MSTSNRVFPSYQGESTIFDKRNFLYQTPDTKNLLRFKGINQAIVTQSKSKTIITRSMLLISLIVFTDKKRECNMGERERGAPKAKEGSIKNYKFLLSLQVAKDRRNILFQLLIISFLKPFSLINECGLNIFYASYLQI